MISSSVDDENRAKRADRRRAVLGAHRRAASSASGVDTPAPSEAVLALFGEAEKRHRAASILRDRDPIANRGAIAAHERSARQLEAEAGNRHRADREQAWLAEAMADTARQAAARGDEVETETVELVTFVMGENGEQLRHRVGSRRGEPVTQVDRVTRVVNKTKSHGLVQAFEKGWLDGGQGAPAAGVLMATGMLYASAFEALDPLRSAFGSEGGGGFMPKAPQVKTVEAGETLEILRRDLSAREQLVLDAVCGKGEHVRAISRTRNGFPWVRRNLRNGLRKATEAWSAARKSGEAGKAARSVAQGTRAINQAARERA